MDRYAPIVSAPPLDHRLLRYFISLMIVEVRSYAVQVRVAAPT